MTEQPNVLSLQFKKLIVALFALAFIASVVMVGLIERERAKPEKAAVAHADADSRKCIECHEEKHIAVDWIRQWSLSRHGEKGVGCIACHEAQEDDPDAWDHEGFFVTHVPTPNDCEKCHQKEVREFSQSHHAKAAEFIGSLDNMLGEVVEGGPAANMGCKQCHGSHVELDEKTMAPIAGTWPNTGIGRFNPDGSQGTCTACHTRHMFSKMQAREPQTCGRCHMGPDHPQLEIFQESKHGINFVAFHDKMNLDADEWVVGKTYTAAPACATCHMAATPTQESSHDVGHRISWTLRPILSTHQEDWETKRGRMQGVCMECHAKTWVENYFKMYDEAVELYNSKFGGPAKNMMDQLRDAGKITPTPFDDKIEWTFFELWHHEGRRARMGASMMGPDYTQWHGFYEVAKHFYTKFLPEVEELQPGLSKELLDTQEHKWKKGMTKEEIQQMLDFYQERYGQKIR